MKLIFIKFDLYTIMRAVSVVFIINHHRTLMKSMLKCLDTREHIELIGMIMCGLKPVEPIKL